jgi:hypothetical protein
LSFDAAVPSLVGHGFLVKLPPDAPQRRAFQLRVFAVPGQQATLGKSLQVISQKAAVAAGGTVGPKETVVGPLPQGSLAHF